MTPEIERLAQSLLREVFSHKFIWLGLAILISAASLSVAFLLPSKYTAYSSILTENKSIVGPLMEGMAEQTDVSDLANIVRELAFSRRSLDQILEQTNLVSEGQSPAQLEFERQKLTERTSIKNQGANLIGIEYTDVDPQRAFAVTQMLVDWVISESRESKRRESQQAFEFIEKQVSQYHDKLIAAEDGLTIFRSENMDALPESAQQVTQRATQLRRDYEALQLQLSELEARKKILQEQLSGEAKITNAMGQEAEYRTRLGELQRELDTLRLSYHDTYPDIIRIMGQIDELRRAITGESREDSNIVVNNSTSEGDNQQSLNPLYTELRSQLSAATTDIRSVEARMQELGGLLAQEVSRSQRIAVAEAQLSELTRDYEVNRQIYQDLLRRRENARVSMNLDAEDQGLIMQIQEPPAVPQRPSGLRFMHIAAAGLMLSLAVPFALSAAMVQFDPRIKVREQLEELKIPVLAVVSEMHYHTPGRSLRPVLLGLGVVTLAAMYGIAAYVRLQGGSSL